MSKNDFQPFRVGTVFNAYKLPTSNSIVSHKLTVRYPSRLEAMALDPSKIAENNNLVYEAGQIDISVGIFKHITVEVVYDSKDILVTPHPRESLIRHAALIMKNALGFEHGLNIEVVEDLSLKHCGLGSSSSLIAGVAAAINELYGKAIPAQDMVRYCTQNHGEEIEGNEEYLMPVQCIGGSAVCGHYEGSLIVLAGQATPIFQHKLPDKYQVVIGVPSDFKSADSKSLMDAEIAHMSGFSESGALFGREVSYRLIHEVLPSLVNNDVTACKKLIFDYRWDMGSIKNCSFVYPRMNDIALSLRDVSADDRIKLLSLSSVGPGFFIVCEPGDVSFAKDIFNELGMDTYAVPVNNDTYSVERSA